MTNAKCPTSLQSKSYPNFIRNSIFIKAFPKPKKIFPKIGLKNCEVALSSIKINTLKSSNEIQDRIDDYINDIWQNSCIRHKQIHTEISKIIDSDYICNNKNEFQILKLIKGKNDIIKIILQIEDYFKNSKCNCFIKTNKFTVLPTDNKKLCFSSDGNKGYWDIATMSMRGIRSCMAWGSSNSKSLIGSILDPYVGVIYITDDTQTKYGKRMLARSVVRFVFDGKTPKLFLEHAYITESHLKYSNMIELIFTSFITSKSGLLMSDDAAVIPVAETTKHLIDYKDRDLLSYRDSDLDYDKVRAPSKFARIMSSL